MAENIALIEPHKIHPNEENPRIIFREDELLALAQGALRVLKGEEKAMEY